MSSVFADGVLRFEKAMRLSGEKPRTFQVADVTHLLA